MWERFGKELCIVVTNLNQMSVEYFHPKTTPNTPIRRAVRMSVALPGETRKRVAKGGGGAAHTVSYTNFKKINMFSVLKVTSYLRGCPSGKNLYAR